MIAEVVKVVPHGESVLLVLAGAAELAGKDVSIGRGVPGTLPAVALAHRDSGKPSGEIAVSFGAAYADAITTLQPRTSIEIREVA